MRQLWNEIEMCWQGGGRIRGLIEGGHQKHKAINVTRRVTQQGGGVRGGGEATK